MSQEVEKAGMSKEYSAALRTLGVAMGGFMLIVVADPLLIWLAIWLAPGVLSSFWSVEAIWMAVVMLVITACLLRHLLKDRPEQRVR